MLADYLRAQARTCLQWARDCFDLGTAAQLRLMAEEFQAKAAEIEANSRSEADFEHPAARHAPPLEIGGDAP